MATPILIFTAGLIVLLVVLGIWQRRVDRVAARTANADPRAGNEPRARGLHPVVNPYRCIGCGACVAACPEGGVLGLADGRAMVFDGARCAGHGRCEQVCPVGALQVGFRPVQDHDEIPVLSDALETTVPGLFLAGEIGGFALVRDAVEQGVTAMTEIAGRIRMAPGAGEPGAVDVAVVGAGPAGLAATLRAIECGLSYVTLEQEEAGGAIRHYPRQKLVITQPMHLPLHGALAADAYRKDDLLMLWQEILRRYDVRIRRGERLEAVSRERDVFVLSTPRGTYRARHVLLALGRRGSPRRLGVPGEDLDKVYYRLIDTATYRDRNLLVVGGGNSAVEAAVGLATQAGNRVSLSYRRDAFSRITDRNRRKLERAERDGRLEVLLRSRVTEIGPGSVRLALEGASRSGRESREVANDFVFIFAGGEAPRPLLERAGVRFGVTPAAAPARN